MQKNQNKKKLNVDDSEISENKEFLTIILNSNIEARKKISKFLAQINQNIRVLKQIIKELIEEVK